MFGRRRKKQNLIQTTCCRPSSRSSSYNASIKPRTANLEAQYGTKFVKPHKPAIDDMATICPRRFDNICGRNACNTHMCASTFISNILRISSALCFNNEWHGIIPALFTIIDTWPTSVWILLANAKISSRFVTSHLKIKKKLPIKVNQFLN